MADLNVKWTGGLQFLATDNAGRVVVTDGQGQGFGPPSLLLAAIVGCAGVDVVRILEKKRKKLTGIEVTVSKQNAPDPPWTIERIDVAAGQVYNVGGGPENSLAVWCELGPMLAMLLGHEVQVARDQWRPGDQRIFVADIRKAEQELDWRPRTSKDEGVQRLYEWVVANKSLFG